jgi:hypothetical protein
MSAGRMAPHATRADKIVRQAANKAPGTITKQNRGHPSKRKSFKVWTVSQLLERYQDPRAILLEIASTPTAQLAEQMHGTLADALAERRLCAQAVLPYVAQKLPVQVDMRHTRAIVLNIVDDRQYEQLVTLDSERADDEDAFSIALMPGNSPDLASNETPVTPPTTDAPTGEE